MKKVKKLRFNNTYKSGAVTYVIFKEKNKFVGVCLEFDLEVAARTMQEAREHIDDFSRGWLENVVKKKLPEELLNKPAPKKYWKIYQQARAAEEGRVKSPVAHVYQPYTPQFPLFAQ